MNTAGEINTARRATLLCLAALTVMSGATIAPSLPALQAHFNKSVDSELLTRLVLTLPALLIAICAPLAGLIADRCGRLRLLQLSVLLYGCAGISGLLLDSLPAILTGRALLGIAVAGTMTSVTALVGDYFTGAAREKFMGQQAAFTSFGGVLFLTAGGMLADWHWRAPFAVYGVAFALLPATLLLLAEPQPPQPRPRATADSKTRGPRALLYAVFGTALLNSLAFYLIPTQLPFLLWELGVAQPSRAGLAIGGGNLLGAVSSLMLYRRLRARLGDMGVFIFGFAVMAAGMMLISGADGFASAAAATAVYGIGMGAIMPHLFNTAMQLAPPTQRGRVSGALTASIFLGQFLSPLATQPWIAHFGLAPGFAYSGMLLLALAVAALITTAISGRARTPAQNGNQTIPSQPTIRVTFDD